MKIRFLGWCLVAMIVTLWAIVPALAESAGSVLKRGKKNYTDNSEKIAAAYVIDNRPTIPEPNLYSHLIFCSGVFNDNLDGVVIRYPEKLKAISELKKTNPELKIILDLSDSRGPGFSEVAADKKKRKAYAKSVKEIIQKYNLDGVELDWEFPTIAGSGHNFRPDDDKNYVKLVKELRKALGKKAWISYYSNNSGKWIDHKGMLPYVTYVQVSGYNLAAPRDGKPMLHHSALYPSGKTGDWCVSKAIERHIDLGIPKDKILMGIPFFGRGLKPFKSETSYCDFSKYSEGLHTAWDSEAQAPYFCDEEGNLILGYDDERSIEAKFDFIRTNEIPGVFVWCYDFDLPDHPLGKIIEKLWHATYNIPSQSSSSSSTEQ